MIVDELTHITRLYKESSDIEKEKLRLKEVFECIGWRIRSQVVEQHKYGKMLITRAELSRDCLVGRKHVEFSPEDIFFSLPEKLHNHWSDI